MLDIQTILQKFLQTADVVNEKIILMVGLDENQ